MPEPASTSEWCIVSASELHQAIRRALCAHGATDSEADTVASALVDADLRGRHSHGVMRLPIICERLREGLIVPGKDVLRIQSAPSAVLLDGQRGFGHVVAMKAAHLAMDLADSSGISVVGVSNSNHIGSAGYYAEHAARKGSILVVLSTSEALVRPYGGAERLIGTNPIAIGFPADPEPFVLDTATAATSFGNILDHRDRSKTLPDEWAVDAVGRSTTDPSAALDGAINPFGGAKGYGLGLAVALLAGVLPGAAVGKEVAGTLDAESVCNKGDLMIAIRPDVFPEGQTVRERASLYLEEIRKSRPAPDVPRVAVPGDNGLARKAHATQSGVRLPEHLWSTVEALRLVD